MIIAIPDDYANAVHTLPSFRRIATEQAQIFTDPIHTIEERAAQLQDAEALVLLRERTPITAELLARLPALRLITLNGPYPHIDVAACTAHGVALCAAHGRMSVATAELTWGLVLAAMRNLPQEMNRLRAGKWQSSIGTVLHGRTLAILGYGRIGATVAGYGRAFGMRTLAWSRARGQAAALADGHTLAPTRAALFEQADVLSLHLRLNPETAGQVTASDLARMKPTSLLVNTSRAQLIQSGALAEALRQGRPGKAAVDVYEQEPVLGATHPLLALDNAYCTPHLGYFERDQLDAYFNDQYDRIQAFQHGRPQDLVNPEALGHASRG